MFYINIFNLYQRILCTARSLFQHDIAAAAAIILVLILDGLIFDDEPLFEPLEWSLVQTWVIYIYGLTWAAEVIFSSRYGSYSNRDKIVWIGLFKTYYGLLNWLIINLILVTVFVTLPFYFEITYLFSYAVVWWSWFSAPYFFRLISLVSLLLVVLQLAQLSVRWASNRVLILLYFLTIVVIAFMFYFQSLTTWLGFFSDVNTFSKSGWSELHRIVNGPLKWGWGSTSRDHFSYHQTTTTFWAKNDRLLLGSLLFFNIFLFLFIFFLFAKVVVYFKIIQTDQTASHTHLTVLYSSVQYFLFMLGFGCILTTLSVFYQYIRLPLEYSVFVKFGSLITAQIDLMSDVFSFLI